MLRLIATFSVRHRRLVIASWLLVVAATALMALRVTKQALGPVAVMAARAGVWSEHHHTHRLARAPGSATASCSASGA